MMVQLEAARIANQALVQQQPLVAVFAGATTGIGEYTVRALAATHGKSGKGLRVYIIGRKKELADKIFADCQILCPAGQFIFLAANDLSLLKDVDRVCRDVVETEQEKISTGERARIDMLVMTHAILHFGPRKETKEGLDTAMSLLYYSRMRMTTQLLPLLLASNLPASVISVYAAGHESNGKMFPTDLSLRDPSHYGFANTRTSVLHMKTMYMERLAQQHPGRLRLVHVFPGLVVTPAFYSNSHPMWFKVAWKITGPVVKRFMSLSHEEIGQRIVFLASPRYQARSTVSTEMAVTGQDHVAMSTDGVRGGGAYSVNYDGETYDVSKAYGELRKQDFEQKVWDHTQSAFAQIDAGKTFKD